MIETKEKTIDGHEYQVTQFPAMQGIRNAITLAKLFGSSIGGAIGAGSVSEVMNMDISGMVAGIFEKLDETETTKLILKLLSNTHRNRQEMNEVNFNNAYAANYGELVNALKFVLEVNYGGFMGALALAKNTGDQHISAPTEK
jgi:hypothetical protein